MAGITFGGLASGLPPNLVDKIMEAERMPIKNLEVQKGKSEERLKLVTDLETKVSDIRKGIIELANTRGFADIKMISSDPNIVAGTVDPGAAVSGSWNIEVLELANKAAAITNGFPDKDKTEIGVGYFKFETPDGPREVYINGASSTLEGAAKAINNARIGIRATVINDRKDTDAPFKLVLAADGVGEDKQVEYPTLYFLDGDQDLYFEDNREAKNGRIKVDGFEFEINDNTLKDIIPGLTLELRNAQPGRTVNISVKEDLEVVTGKIKTFVDGVNAVLGFIQQQNKLDKQTDTSKTLGGDSLIRGIEQRFRRLIQAPQMGVKSEIRTLNQIGITFTRNGLLEFDQKKFTSALARSPENVQKFLVGDGFATGFIPSLNREISTITNSAFGPLANRKRGLQQSIDSVNQRIETKERQLGRKEDQLRNKFAKLEETMSRLKSQGAALGGGANGGLPNMGGG